MIRPILSVFAGAIVMAMVIGCGSASSPASESIMLPAADTGQSQTAEPSGPVSESELRRVLFDNAILGYQARHPLIIAKVGMQSSNTVQIRHGIAAASQSVSALNIHERVWTRIFQEVQRDTLIAAYEFTRDDAFQRCASVGISQLQRLNKLPPDDFENNHQRNPNPAHLTQAQETAIASYLEREAPFLRQMDSEMAYWTALGTAIIMNEMINHPTVTITDQERLRIQASLSHLMSSLRDETHFLKNNTSALSLADRQKELAAIFKECNPGDADVYWEFVSAPQFQAFHHATWRIFYDVTTTSMKSLLEL